MSALKTVTIDDTTLRLAEPTSCDARWIGQLNVLEQLLACWIVLDEADRPLSPRVTGLPGMGKTTLAMAAAAHLERELYVFQCTADTRPEDLIITPVLIEDGKIAYQASALATAMIRGGICVLDEGNRMNEKSWASLAPLLDHRQSVESIIAGITLHAHRDFRCCVTMNQDESTFEIPDYISSRLQPSLSLGFPNRDDELEILRYHLPFADHEMLALTVEFLQRAHELKLDFSPRDGLNILRFLLKRLSQDQTPPLSHAAFWDEAVSAVLGDDALDLESMAKSREISLGGHGTPSGLADFFYGPDGGLPEGFEFGIDEEDEPGNDVGDEL